MISNSEFLTPLNEVIALLVDMNPEQLQNAKSKISKILEMIERLE